MELIPFLMKDVAPDLIVLANASMKNYIVDNRLLSTSFQDSLLQIDEEIYTFTKKFALVINGHLDRMHDAFLRYTSCVCLLDLYNKCMLEKEM